MVTVALSEVSVVVVEDDVAVSDEALAIIEGAEVVELDGEELLED